MKSYKVTYTNSMPTQEKRGQFVATMQGINPADALKNWNAARLPGYRLNAFYLHFEEV